MERKAALGEWTGGSIPFGYRLDPERRFLVPKPSEAAVVPQIFRRYTQRLEGSSALATWLTDRGLRTRNGKPFNVPAVLSILRNRAYVGEIFFRGSHYPAPHEPLVDRRSSSARRRSSPSAARTSRCGARISPNTC